MRARPRSPGRTPMRGWLRGWLPGLAILSVAGCGNEREIERRYAAERARWDVDRQEETWLEGRRTLSAESRLLLRAWHAGLAEEFGPARDHRPGEPIDPVRVERYRIAGGSALYALDLEALDAPSRDLAARYARLAELFAFDAEVAVRAQLRSAWVQERLGDPAAALARYDELLTTFPAASPDFASGLRRILFDLEVHAAALARWLHGPQAPARHDAVLARHGALDPSSAANGTSERLLAETLLAEGDEERGLAMLRALRKSVPHAGERAVVDLRIGEVLELARNDVAGARASYDRAFLEGPNFPAGVEARSRLGELELAEEDVHEALVIFDELVSRNVEGTRRRRAELLGARARCHLALGRTAEALDDLREAARTGAGTAPGVEAAARIFREPELRALFEEPMPGEESKPGESAVALVLHTVDAMGPPAIPPFAATTLTERQVRARQVSAWRNGLMAVETIASGGGADASRARALAVRIREERLGVLVPAGSDLP